MAKKDVIEAMGTVVDAQPNAMFKVKLDKMCIRDRHQTYRKRFCYEPERSPTWRW